MPEPRRKGNHDSSERLIDIYSAWESEREKVNERQGWRWK